MNNKKYKITVLLLKFLAVFLILAYLINNEKLTVDSLSFIFINVELFISLILIILSISIPLVSLRWAIILKNLDSKKKTLFELYKITLIAQFFAIFIPGSATADLTKGYYLHKDNKNKTNIYFSILLDRIMGLYSIIILIFIVYAVNFDLINSYKFLSLFCNLLLVGFTMFNLVFFLFKNRLLELLQHIKFKFIGEKIKKIVDCIILVKKITLVKTLALSMLNQITLIAIFIIINIPFNNLVSGDFMKIAFITPLGEIASMIPLFPIGIGIGQYLLRSYICCLISQMAQIFLIFL